MSKREGAASFISGFSQGFTEAMGGPKSLLEKAEDEMDFFNSAKGIEYTAFLEKRKAAGEALNQKRKRDTYLDSQLNYFTDESQKEAVNSFLSTQDIKGLERFDKETIGNEEFTGLISLDFDKTDLETYRPYIEGDLKRVGNSNYFYHSKGSRNAKVAYANDEYMGSYNAASDALKKLKGVDILNDSEKKVLQDETFQMLSPTNQRLFRQQSVNFNDALNDTITTYKGGLGSLIFTNKSFTAQLQKYTAALEVAKGKSPKVVREMRENIDRIKKIHRQQQLEGYGYSEVQYRAELKNLLSYSVGAIGLSDRKQIRDFMSTFLNKPKNQEKFLNTMIRKYGPPKIDSSTTGPNTGSNANIKDVSQLKTHLKTR